MTTSAGSSTTVKNRMMKMSVMIRARGCSTTYAPSTALTAPDAPSVGTDASRSTTAWSANAAIPPAT
jgi:hypothetical protein